MVSRMQSRITGAVLGTALAAMASSPTFAQAQKPPAKPAPAQVAPQPKSIGHTQSWDAYTYPAGGGNVCYVVGEPAKKEPGSAKRDRVNALVTHNTAEKTQNVVSFVAGYPFADKATVELDIDGKKWKLFTNADTAWAFTPAEDKQIVEAMMRGKQAVVKGSSSRGTATTDTYSLAGFSQVLKDIDKACNVKR
jgi:hypothetical protein